MMKVFDSQVTDVTRVDSLAGLLDAAATNSLDVAAATHEHTI